jgi:ribose 5-phosphate isomerase B
MIKQEPGAGRMKLGIAADHGGFHLDQEMVKVLEAAGHQVEDYGAYQLVGDDHYPDFVVPMARAVARGEVVRGLAICGSGVGTCIEANKIRGARAGLMVEDDDRNVIWLGARLIVVTAPRHPTLRQWKSGTSCWRSE